MREGGNIVATEVVMPRLSDTMETGTVGKWLKNEGDRVSKGETLAEIETDKANMEMESYADGILARIMVKAGESAGLGEPIAIIAADEDEAKKISREETAPEPEKPGTLDQVLPDQGPPAAPQVGKTEPNERIKASPLARRLAQEHDVDLLDVAGTGPGSRITKEDVESFLKQAAPVGQTESQKAPAESQPQAQPPQAPATGTSAGRGAQPAEMSRMQQTIARRMVEAKNSIPEFYLTSEIDMTAARAFLRDVRTASGGPKVGANDLLIKAAALALRRNPTINSGWEDGRIVRFSRVNVGFAVALPDGLVVPVIQDADTKTLSQIGAEAKELIERARTGKLAPADYDSGTFTISNLGMYPIEQFTAIINPPEACIMAVGRMESTPVVAKGEVVIRDCMLVTLSCDHRVVYGAQGAEFLRTFGNLLAQPLLTVL